MTSLKELEELKKRYKLRRKELNDRVEKEISEMSEKLVPRSGKANTVAGEILRAINRIGYRKYNDGDHIGVGYGKETVNPAARYLMKNCNDKVKNIITKIWGIQEEDDYDKELDKLKFEVLIYLISNPELKTTENMEDMWDYRNKEEDVDKGNWEE